MRIVQLILAMGVGFLFTCEAFAQAKSHGLGSPNGLVQVVEPLPEFPGGYKALTTYLEKNIKLPPANIEGRVIVSFIVSTSGKIDSPKIMRGLCEACDMEAIRLVKAMPKWIPGKVNGKPVSCRYTIPVRFTCGE